MELYCFTQPFNTASQIQGLLSFPNQTAQLLIECGSARKRQRRPLAWLIGKTTTAGQQLKPDEQIHYY